MAFPLLGSPKPQFSDANGVPFAAGTLDILDPDNDSFKTNYPTANDADANTNGRTTTLTLDERGEPETGLFGRDGEDYKLVLKDVTGATIWTVDDIRVPIALPYLKNAFEDTAGVTIVNIHFKPGNILRYGTNTTPGTTDMTTAFQAAVDVAEAGGVFVDLAQQDLLVTASIKIASGPLVLDMRGAIITSSGNFPGGKVTTSAIINIGNDVAQTSEIIVLGGKIVGPVSTGEAWGIQVTWSKNIWIEGVHVEDAEDAGIRIAGYGTTYGDSSHFNSRDEGFTSYITVKDCYIKNTTAGAGIELIADPTHCNIDNNKIDACVVNGLRVVLAAFSNITNNIIQDTGNNSKSLYIGGRGNIVTGNNISGKNSSGSNVLVGIYLAESVVDSLIADNIIRDVSGEGIDGNTDNDGTHVVSGTTIRGNQIYDWGTGSEWGIIIRGAGSDDNIIENNELFGTVSTTRGINVQAGSGRAPIRNIVRDNLIKAPSTLITVSGRLNRNYRNIDHTSMAITDNLGPDDFFDTAVPTAGTFEKGQFVRNTASATSDALGWACTQSGTQGTLSSVTGTITSGTTALVVNSSTNLEVRDRITIVGVAGIKTITAISGTAVTISTNADASVTDADVAYSTAIFQPTSNANEVVTSTNVITAVETDTTFYLDTAGGFTSTLPAPAANLRYTFIVSTAPTTAYIITTNSGGNVLYGTFLDIVGELVYFSAQDTLNFVASTSLVGDRLEVESDGTNWYCKAFSGADVGITVAVT